MKSQQVITGGALSGVRVLDLSRYIAGPHCAMLLGDMGAEVVKVEGLPSGDNARALGHTVNGESIYYMVHNRNKRGVTLNFRHPKASGILQRLVESADVLVENFRPGTMEAMGCPYSVLREINPRLVMVSISGYGQDGPMSERVCKDSIAQAMSGLQAMTGSPEGPPTQSGTFVADYITALYATVGVLTALHRRETTGKGQLVDVSLLDSMISVLGMAIPNYLLLGLEPERKGNRNGLSAPADTFRVKDGWVHVTAGEQRPFLRLLKAMGQEERINDYRFATARARLENIDDTDAFVGEWMAQYTADEIMEKMGRVGVPCGKSCEMKDVVANPQLHHRGQIVEMEHPVAGRFVAGGVTIKLSESPGTIARPAPTLGQHNEEVYSEWIGLSQADICALRQEGVI